MDDLSSPQIGDEPVGLKCELRSFRMENGDSDSQSWHALDAPKPIIPKISPLRKPFSQPPPEVLHMIFERTIPPYFLLESSASFCPGSLFCLVLRQKISVVNVCRTWYSIGLPFLYEHIFVRRVHQLAKLLKTLIKYPPNLNWKEIIKTLDIYCHVPEWYGPYFAQQLQALFHICPRITSCAFRLRSPITALLCATVTSITSLSFKDIGINPGMLEIILQLVSRHIVSLSFHIPELDLESTAIRHKHFLNLQNISIWLTESTAPNFDPLVRPWKVPHLKRFTFSFMGYKDSDFPGASLKDFCDAHGKGLQYLHIKFDASYLPFSISPPTDILIPDLSRVCPDLKHIVLPPWCLPWAHKHVEWLDIWAWREVGFDLEGVRSKIKKTDLPALKGVRILPFYLRNEYPCDLPLFIPPDLVSTPRDTFECQFLGVGIRHDAGEIHYIKQPNWPDDEDDTELENEGDATTSDEENGPDGEFITDESDLDDESDYTNTDHGSWEVGSNSDTDWDAKLDGLETDFPWLGNI